MVVGHAGARRTSVPAKHARAVAVDDKSPLPHGRRSWCRAVQAAIDEEECIASLLMHLMGLSQGVRRIRMCAAVRYQAATCFHCWVY
eukprot:COSAG01_NODE_6385_length_3702_cov_3.140716_4_plen_87_part_00